jgi:hypothetical protein
VEHLGRTYGGTAKMLEKSLNVASNAVSEAAGHAASAGAASRPGSRPTPPQVTLKQRWLQFVVVRMGRFPSEGKAPSFTLPEGRPGPEALQRTLSGLGRMQAALDAAEQRWGNRQRLGAHFFFGPMTAEQWRKFHYVHGHHHVLQIRERSGK